MEDDRTTQSPDTSGMPRVLRALRPPGRAAVVVVTVLVRALALAACSGPGPSAHVARLDGGHSASERAA
ncbi:MAG TPA: hypothetical protein VL961_12450 [Acidimicrobiales bacterium]|nr:hypothetical protein [Acidimicrobiales bacterium]